MKNIAYLIWRIAVSPVSFVAISIAWCLDLGVGSILAYKLPELYGGLDAYPLKLWLQVEGARAWPSAIWIHVLVLLTYLMVASLFLCTLNWFFYRRKRMSGVGEVLVHLGFLLVFGGYVVGSVFGARTLGIRIPPGTTGRVAAMDAVLTVKDLRPILSPGGDVQGEESDLELVHEGKRFTRSGVRINHPLIAGATVVYPRGVAQHVEGVRVAIGGQTAHLLPGRPIEIGGGKMLEISDILQPEESAGNFQGPGVFLVERGREGAIVSRGYLSPQEGMPQQGMAGGMKLELVGLTGPYLANFDIHYDPGVWLVICGALLIAIGSLWALWGYLNGPTPSPASD